jgi:hypothetical protein
MTFASVGKILRENVLRDLASRAANDPEFLMRVRKDLESTLAQHGYHLTGEELRVVNGLQRQTPGMSDEELARMLAHGLQRRTGCSPARPPAPSWQGADPTRPAQPGR